MSASRPHPHRRTDRRRQERAARADARCQFRRYERSRILFFDFGGSARAATLSMGGSWRDLGGALSEDAFEPVSLQPLANIVDLAERGWAAEWIAAILARENVTVTPEVKDHIWSSLSSLASAPVHERTITGLLVLLGAIESPKNAHSNPTIADRSADCMASCRFIENVRSIPADPSSSGRTGFALTTVTDRALTHSTTTPAPMIPSPRSVKAADRRRCLQRHSRVDRIPSASPGPSGISRTARSLRRSAGPPSSPSSFSRRATLNGAKNPLGIFVHAINWSREMG